MAERYDYIVVGAGSAGCVVANRLSANPANRVLLLEAGPSDRSYRIQMPAAFTYAIDHRKFDWRFESEIESSMDKRRMPYPRGKVLGGSSSINAMSFTRGNPHDFEHWAGNGLANWSYAHCLPYFKRMETFSGGASDYRGGEGPLRVTQPVFSNPLYEVFLRAGDEAGYPRSENPNGVQHEGLGPLDQSIHDGVRMSTSEAYLRPIRGRSNLEIRTGCFVERVTFEGQRATGVEVSRAGGPHVIACDREVVLCAGALKTPQLLMLSGIGDADELARFDLGVIVHRPAVGRHLQDHLDIQMQYVCRQPVTVTPSLKLHRKALIGIKWLLSRSGEGATNHFEAGGNIRSNADLRTPDLAAWFMPLLVNYDGSPVGVNHGYQLTLMLLRPLSRGRVGLRSPDPRDPPLIQPNFLHEPGDLASLRAGVKIGRHILSRPAFDAFRGPEILPGERVQADAEIDHYIRATAKSTRHPCCTCSMGIDEESSVVDGYGKVHGCERLRVIDASVMPGIVGAALNAPTIMVAEKLAATLAGEPPLEPLMREAARALAL